MRAAETEKLFSVRRISVQKIILPDVSVDVWREEVNYEKQI